MRRPSRPSSMMLPTVPRPRKASAGATDSSALRASIPDSFKPVPSAAGASSKNRRPVASYDLRSFLILVEILLAAQRLADAAHRLLVVVIHLGIDDECRSGKVSLPGFK